MCRPKRWPDTPDIGANGQAVIDRVLATVAELEACEHELDGFALWISTRPRHLLCGFCYQACQVLAHDIRCAACREPAGDPSCDAVVVAKISDALGVHFYLCHACADTDLDSR
ncbi:MAG TPA: hypothetical protein VF834_23005 [Streptosporangiaceae bacterium]